MDEKFIFSPNLNVIFGKIVNLIIYGNLYDYTRKC
jgi:hypothetical protein